MTNPPETTASKSRRKNSCPDGWLNAGAKVPIHLTVGQEEYCREAVDIHRFCYNLAVRTHRFCRSNRLPWPSWMDLSKAFNAGKREDHPFVTRVAAVVATGAFRDFGQAVDNWRNPGLRARSPKTKRPAFTGAGSFLAAGSVKEVRYDGKRRVKLPCLGSVKLDCTLPRGICHEASIRRENGRWYLSLKLWKPPGPKPERAPRPGGIDTGINPLGTDSDGQTYRNPKASYVVQKKLRRWQRAQARRQKGSRGWWEAQRKIDKCHRRIRGLRHNAQHHMTSTVTRKFSDLVIEDLNVAGLMRGNTPRAQADAGMGDLKRQMVYKGLWRHTRVVLAPRWFPSSKTCSACGTVNPNLKREPTWTCPDCGARHDRNLNAAINLRNLIAPAGRRRNGRAQDAVVQQMPLDSWHGEPGVVKDVPHLREWGRGTDTGTEAEGPARGSGNHRSRNAPSDPSASVIPSGPRRDGRGQQEVVPGKGTLASRRGRPGSVPERKDRSHLQGRRRTPGEGMDLDKRRPQARGVETGTAGP